MKKFRQFIFETYGDLMNTEAATRYIETLVAARKAQS